MSTLEERRFIVTGASKGIGKAIAARLIEDGARVVITARDPERLALAAREIGAEPIVADAGREVDIVRSVEEAVTRLGGLDGLVNNAGIAVSGPIDELDGDDFRRVLDVNVVGAALMVREVIPHLRESGGGDIVNIASTSGLRGDPGATIYSASKFALRAMTQCWQAELRRHDVRVTVVNPSRVQTGFGRREDPPHPETNLLHASDIAHAVATALTLEPRGFVPEITVFATNPW